jgi:phosphoribosylformylglycinamidine (FGAM) synthase-like enzyme
MLLLSHFLICLGAIERRFRFGFIIGKLDGEHKMKIAKMLVYMEAVQSCSDFAIELGINIPTGKDSLSMKQKYPNDDSTWEPVIISAAGNCSKYYSCRAITQHNGGNIYCKLALKCF